jgi:hypothetical protein
MSGFDHRELRERRSTRRAAFAAKRAPTATNDAPNRFGDERLATRRVRIATQRARSSRMRDACANADGSPTRSADRMRLR